MVSRRGGGCWSPPCALALYSLGWGIQAGGALCDLLIVLRTPAAVAAFCGALHCGVAGSLSLAVGPLGRQAQATMQVRGADALCLMFLVTQQSLPSARNSLPEVSNVLGSLSVEGSALGFSMAGCSTAYGTSQVLHAVIACESPQPSHRTGQRRAGKLQARVCVASRTFACTDRSGLTTACMCSWARAARRCATATASAAAPSRAPLSTAPSSSRAPT